MADEEIAFENPDEELVEVPEDEEEGEKDAPIVYSEEDPNLVAAFMVSEKGRKWLDEAVSRVKEDWDREWEATEEHRKRVADDWRIFSGELPPLKDPPYSFCANAHVPIMIENVSRIVFRASGELFNDWSQVYTVMPMGPEDARAADVLTIHGNWQIRSQIPDFKRQLAHRGMLAFFVIGDVSCRSYYDTRSGLNCHEILTPDDFVTPFVYVTTKPDYSDLPWYAFKFLRYRHEMEAETENWYGVDELLAGNPPRLSDEPDAPLAETVAEIQGKTIDDASKSAPYKLIHWEGWMSIPPPDGVEEIVEVDGEELLPKQRFLQIIIDYQTKHPLKVMIHEMPNWQEKARFQRQSQELQAYREARLQHDAIVSAHQAQIQEQEQMLQAHLALGDVGAMQANVAQEALAQLSSMPLPPPPPAPAWLTDPDDPMAAPEPPKKEPVRLFSHAVCIEPLVGNLGLSYGRMEADFNRAANILLNQFIDSATLANIKMMLVAGQNPFDGKLEWKPGGVIPLKGLAGNIKDSIMPLEFPPANPQLVELVDKLVQYGNSAMQAPTVLSGDPGKSGETYRGLSARIEQATKQLSVLTGKYRDFLEQVLKHNALLNSFFLREEEIFMIANHMLGEVQEIRVGRQMYERNYMVEIRADLRFTSQAQKIQEADELVAMSTSVPILAQNPDFQHAAVKKALEARGLFDFAKLLGPPPSVAYQQAVAQAQAQGLPPPPPPGMPPQQQAPQQGPPRQEAAE